MQRRPVSGEDYGLLEDPFSLGPDLKFLYLGRSHWEALSSMMSGIEERKGILVITGDVGIGKTTLIYALLKDLSEKMKTAFIFNPRLEFKDMLAHILRALTVPIQEKETNILSLLVRFRRYLNERLAQDETVTLVFDEAQSLGEEVLENLLRMKVSDIPAAKLLQILLIGHPELETKLNSDPLCRYRDKIGLHFQIKALSREEGREYINYRLMLTGQNIRDVFALEAADRFWEFAQGNPRIINLLCGRALSIRDSHHRPIVDSKTARQAIQDLGYLRPRISGLLPWQKKNRAKIIRILFFIISVSIFSFTLGKILIRLFQK